MSDDKIAEIRARHAATEVYQQSLTDRVRMHNDRAFLLAEVDRQRADNERLRADLATQQGCCDGAAAQDAHIRREREEHKAEIEKLRAENERLRAALENIVGHWNHTHDDALKRWEGSSTRAFEDLEYVEAAAIKPLVDIARAALEGKQ